MANENSGRNVMVDGRIVWVSGDLFKGKVKTEFGTQIPKKHPQTGEQMLEFGFGIAVPKTSLGQNGPGQPGEIWAAIHQEAMTMFPNGQIPPAFAMKFKDGDGIDDQGRPFAQREGYAGHLIFACTTSLPIKYFRLEGGQHFMVNDGIKCGDYVRVQLNIKAHPAQGQGKAGLYLNPNAAMFLGYGKEIINAPSGEQIFGSTMPPLPPGASATPLAAAPGMPFPTGGAAPAVVPPNMPTFAPQNGNHAMGNGFAQPAYPSNPPMPAMPPQPHFGVLPQAHQPPQGGQPIGTPAWPMGNGQPQGAYPAPGAGAIPSGVPMPQYSASPAAPQGVPAFPGYPQR